MSEVTNVFHGAPLVLWAEVSLLLELSVTFIVAFLAVFVVVEQTNQSCAEVDASATRPPSARGFSDQRDDYSFSLFTVRSSNSIQASGTRQGLINGGCTVAPTVSLQPCRSPCCTRSRCLVKSG